MAFSPLSRLRTVSSKNLPILTTVILVGIALIATGCHPRVTDPKDPKFIVAEKGDWQVLRSDLDTQINAYLQQNHITPEQIGPDKMPMLETAMLDNIVLKKLLLDKAAAMQPPPKDVDKEAADQFEKIKAASGDKEFEEQLKTIGLTVDELKKRIHEKILIGKVLEAEAFKNAEPTEQEIDDIYVKNKEHFVIPAQVRASRILVLVGEKATPAEKAAKKKAIDAAHARVVKGEDFGKVAAEVSEDQYSKGKGGDIGSFPKGVNEPGFDEVAFNTKENAVSPVFQTTMGYQFLKVTNIQAGGPVPIADARSFIAGKLRNVKMGEQQESYSKKLLADSGVTYHLVRVDMPGKPPAPAPGQQEAVESSAPSTTPPAPATPPAK